MGDGGHRVVCMQCMAHMRNLLRLKCVRRLRKFEKRDVVVAEAVAVLAAFPAVDYDAPLLQELCATPGATLSTGMHRVVDRAAPTATAKAKRSDQPVAPPRDVSAPDTHVGRAVEDEEADADRQDTEIENQETEVVDGQAGANVGQTVAEDEPPEAGGQETQSTQPQQDDGVTPPAEAAAPLATAGLATAGSQPPSPIGSVVPETQSAEIGAASDPHAPPQAAVGTALVPADAGPARVPGAELAAAPDASSAPTARTDCVPAQDCGPAPVRAAASAPMLEGGPSPVAQAGRAAPLADDGSSPLRTSAPFRVSDLPCVRTAERPQEQLRPEKGQASEPPPVARDGSGQALTQKTLVSANARAAAAARSGMPWRAKRGRPPGTRRASVGERAEHPRPGVPLGPVAEQRPRPRIVEQRAASPLSEQDSGSPPAERRAGGPPRFPHTHPLVRQWCKLGLLMDAPGCSERRVVRRLRTLRAAATMADEGAVHSMDQWYSSPSGGGPASVAGLRQLRRTRQQREADMLAVVSREMRGLPGGRSPTGTSRGHTSDAADALAMLAEENGTPCLFVESPSIDLHRQCSLLSVLACLACMHSSRAPLSRAPKGNTPCRGGFGFHIVPTAGGRHRGTPRGCSALCPRASRQYRHRYDPPGEPATALQPPIATLHNR